MFLNPTGSWLPTGKMRSGRAGCPLECPEYIEIAAQDIVDRFRAWGLNSDQSTTDSMVTADLDNMDHNDGRLVGCERIRLQALEELQLGRILEDLGMSELDMRRALARVTAKIVYSVSERETSRWMKNNSSLPELPALTKSLDLVRKTLYRIGDCLWKRQAEIEKQLIRRERNLLNISATTARHVNVHVGAYRQRLQSCHTPHVQADLATKLAGSYTCPK